jgi:nitroimidazol reductase NimA-like FMN-containing flavoprotein (pyridoxamine 5'-phosphate oxidase superfamily)
MKTHPLTKEKVDKLLSSTATGSLATLNNDGSPYVIPVHFLYYNDAIYIHGLPKGQKIDNIKADPRISMTVYEMDSILLDPNEKPCDTNTKYESVVVSGKAILVDDLEHKKEVLVGIVKKYTPHLAQKELPDNMVKGTAVIKIEMQALTGKYYE